MVVIALDIETKLYEGVKHAVEVGNYSSLKQFFEAAAWNQIALEESAVGRTPTTLSSPGSPHQPAETTDADAHGLVTSEGEWKRLVQKVDAEAFKGLPEPTILDGEGDLLWGQTNRVLPIAVGVRVLAHLLSEGDESVARSSWHQAATRTARQLRAWLRNSDVKAGRQRGELWATAFPQDDEGSGRRYVNQFLGVPRKTGISEGGAAFLGLVVFDGLDDSSPVRLTTSGAKWASLENPIFDSDEPARTFSAEETRFFVDHLRQYRPAEYGMLDTVASLVEQGRSRTEINVELADAYPNWAKYIETMRAGAIGRLSDLGLLSRTRRGLEVDYHLTPLAANVGLPERIQEVRA